MSQAGIINLNTIQPSIPTTFNEDVGSATPVANTLNIVGGIGITTSGSGNTVTITATGAGFTWSVVTSANNPVTLTNENGYIVKGASPVNFILPATATIGNTYRIIGYGNLWKIAQNAGQSIIIGNSTSTPGIFGSVSATVSRDCLDIICVTSNTEFLCDLIQGNPTIV